MCDSAVIDQCRRAAWMLRRRLECPGWNALGSGHFSVALEVPGHEADLVLKVGGPSRYGHRLTGGTGYTPSDGLGDEDGNPANDGWPLWALESMTHPARPIWMPVVHHFEWLNPSETVYMAILERLEPVDSDSFWLHRPPDLMNFIRDEWIPSMGMPGLDDDLHVGNWMYRLQDGITSVVLTDPVIFRF